MKRILTFITAATLAVSLALPALAQTSIPAPSGWTTQTRANGATTYTPPDLRDGERFSVTLYESVSLGGKTLEAYLRGFAGPVGQKPGQLIAPLKVAAKQNVVVGLGLYRGPNGSTLMVVFSGVSLDGGRSVQTSRVLSSGDEALLKRYKGATQEIIGAMVRLARSEADVATANAQVASQKADAKKAPQAAPEAHEKRDKWMVAPGRGVQLAQIAALVYHTDYGAVFNGINIDGICLLLRDGTVRDDLPCAPDEFDVVRSKQNEPEKWGQWRQQGDKYFVSWAGKPFQQLGGFKEEPGVPGTRLNGRYGGAASHSVGGNGWHASWGVTFDAAGRFKKDASGGSSANVGIGDIATHANTTYGDNGSASAASGPGFTAAAGQKSNPRGDREGTYSINGYTLTLRYDNGRVARWPFFFLGAEGIWFENGLLMQAK